MLRRTAFVGCVLMSAGCLYADDPTESSDALTYTSGMADTTPTRNLGFQNIDEDLQTPAGILYDNGTPDYANGNEMTAWTQANDFTLKGEAMIEHVNFSVLDTAAGSNLANWDGTGSWAIWTDGGAGPGSVIASGIGTNFTTNFDSNNGSWDFWDFGMDLDSPTCLDAGTYWLALHLNRDCTFRANLYWSTTAGGSGSGHYEDGGCAGVFNGPANEHSFNLEGSDGCGGGDECVDFEAGGPCIFNSTNPLRSLYSGQGINFSGPANLDGGAILDECGNFGIAPRSGTQFLAFNRAHNGGVQMLNGGYPDDPETVTLSSPASRVSVWVGCGAQAARWQMDAYDGGGNLLGSNAIGTALGVWGELAVNAAGIRRVVVRETTGAPYFVWDDLCVSFGGNQDCLTLKVDRLIAGSKADWNVSGASAGEQVAIVYGFGPGNTVVNGFAGYCATFGIQGVNQNKVICTKAADGGGNVTCTKPIPAGVKGMRVLSQAAERNTCPDECVSNLDDQVVG